MKKLLLSLLLSCSLASFAQAQDTNFYLGTGYQSNSVDYDNMELGLSDGSIISFDAKEVFSTDYKNINFFAGYNLNQNVALEVGYFKKSGQNHSNNNTGLEWVGSGNPLYVNSESDLEIINFDTVLNTKITDNENLKFLGLVGLSSIKASSKVSLIDGSDIYTLSLSERGVGANIGVGFEYQIIENISARIIAKYTKVSGIDDVDSITSYSFGVKYGF